jgi:uncharacterized protein YprB with RNaseH-like and TPR domain
MRYKPGPKQKKYRAYLDIETTGLSPAFSEITVIGICLEKSKHMKFYQLMGRQITPAALLKILKNVETLYTYNGSRFDLMYISKKLGVNLVKLCCHRDLMYDCWRNKLYGGLKGVERQLGIKRKLKDVDGRIAVQLWWNWRYRSDRKSLQKLLEYNKEDVLNLRKLRRKLFL